MKKYINKSLTKAEKKKYFKNGEMTLEGRKEMGRRIFLLSSNEGMLPKNSGLVAERQTQRT